MLTVALFSFLQPKAIIAEAEVNRGLRMLTFEGMVGIGLNSITGSGFLAAFALALGANNLQIGILAALPFITQPLQIPVVVLVERLKRRKLITIPSQFASQSIWILMALIPIAIGTPSGLAVSALLALMAIRGVLSALVNTSWNGWLSDLVPRDIMGRFFSQRMALATAVAIVFGLGAGFFVDVWQDRVDPAQGIFAYTIALLVGAIVLGLASPVFMALMPEPLMQVPMGEQPSIWSTLAQPFRDRNFRRLLWFLLLSGFALNMAVPFFAVYMLTRLGLPLTAVIGFTVIGQLSNILFLRLWGPLADRYGSKAILSLCTSLYILVIISWTFTTLPDRHFMTIPLLVVLHIFAGAAVAGVSITIGTLGMKIAPEGQSTSYLAAASLATNVGSGLGPLVGGAFAQFFSVRSLQLTFTWIDPNREVDLPTLSLTGFDFLFAIAFVIGLISLNTLTTIREEGEVSRDIVLDELLNQSQGVTRAMSSVPGLRFVTQFPYSYLRRVPGVDVAVGVTAYQIASLTENAAAAGARSQEAGSTIAGGVGNAVSELASGVVDLGDQGVDLARHATRGAIHSLIEVGGDVGERTRQAVVGVMNGLAESGAASAEALRASVYGAVQGAQEAGERVDEAAVNAVEAVKDIAPVIGLSEEEAVTLATEAAMDAAHTLGLETEAEVRAEMEKRR